MNSNCSQPIVDILQKIVVLQKIDLCGDNVSCDRPFLGPLNTLTYNTRPIELYNAYTATPWTFNYNGGTSNIFRIESIDQCSAVIRLLIQNEETGEYTSTNQFVTIDLNTVGAIRCLPDTYISL